MSEIPRVCATCRHFKFEESFEGYSPETPGGDCSFSCRNGYWHASGSDCSEDAFRSSMLAATYCLDYEPVDVAPLKHRGVPEFPEDVGGPLRSLRDRYPGIKFGIQGEGRLKAWYEIGDAGRTTSGSFASTGEAYDWLVTRLEEMEAAGVQAD